MKHKKIAFIGMMGSGKSTIAKNLAENCNLELFEADEIFEKQEKITIRDFFEKFGEEEFREKESEILKKIVKKENFILSTGGGIVLKKENREILFDSDITTIYLKASPNSIYNRIKNQTQRPLLQVQNPREEIEKIIKNREIYYNLANYSILTDNKTINEITVEIEKILWKE